MTVIAFKIKGEGHWVVQSSSPLHVSIYWTTLHPSQPYNGAFSWLVETNRFQCSVMRVVSNIGHFSFWPINDSTNGNCEQGSERVHLLWTNCDFPVLFGRLPAWATSQCPDKLLHSSEARVMVQEASPPRSTCSWCTLYNCQQLLSLSLSHSSIHVWSSIMEVIFFPVMIEKWGHKNNCI